MKIYTRNGDKGMTRLLSGETVDKDDERVKAYGAIDELQSYLGMARALIDRASFNSDLLEVQHDMFVVSAELASTNAQGKAGRPAIRPEDVTRLEEKIDTYTAKFGRPGCFLVPGVSKESAALHVARAVCRRCERLVVMINKRQGVFDTIIVYLNRLSDLLFILAWALEMIATIEEAVLAVMLPYMKKGDAS